MWKIKEKKWLEQQPLSQRSATLSPHELPRQSLTVTGCPGIAESPSLETLKTWTETVLGSLYQSWLWAGTSQPAEVHSSTNHPSRSMHYFSWRSTGKGRELCNIKMTAGTGQASPWIRPNWSLLPDSPEIRAERAGVPSTSEIGVFLVFFLFFFSKGQINSQYWLQQVLGPTAASHLPHSWRWFKRQASAQAGQPGLDKESQPCRKDKGWSGNLSWAGMNRWLLEVFSPLLKKKDKIILKTRPSWPLTISKGLS